jgi:putative MATE family efflux protein
VSGTAVFVLAAFARGFISTVSILIAPQYGRRDFAAISRIISTSLCITLVLNVLLLAVGLALGDFYLAAIHTPWEIRTDASWYLKISLVGNFAMNFMVFLFSILRGMGDTKTPLKIVTVSIIINAGLDPLLLLGLGPFPRLGLNGAAVASIIAQVTAVGMGLWYLSRSGGLLVLRVRGLRVHWPIVRQTVQLGLPAAVQGSLVSLGGSAMVALVNTFGVAATSALGAVVRAESLATWPGFSFTQAVSVLTGQNLGAKKDHRVHDIFKYGLLMSTGVTVVLALFLAIFPRAIMIMMGFGKDEEVIRISSAYLRIVSFGYLCYAVAGVANGVINGAGKTLITMMLGIITYWALRIPLAALFTRMGWGVNGIWLAVSLSFFLPMVISLWYYASGRWKTGGLATPPVPGSDPVENE